ncbi:hypothetical protein FB106_10485 [Synechococcus sp. Ace-Pa]|nr:hypothetical protein [Candidatus Regnicoccus frigidus MAG-AL2]TWB93303.1 hypothetical protein FB106_10485 [Synechococcus sp. Ace-Pa]
MAVAKNWKRLPRLPRLPWKALLPVTTVLVVLLIALPALQLQRFPRSNAAGLERLMSASALIQSFAAGPQRLVPALWGERLGPSLAPRLWGRQRGFWWLFWSADGDQAEPFLAMPSRTFGVAPSGPLPANSLRVDDLVVVAPDPLTLQVLEEQLSLSRRPPQGLQERCVDRLRSGQAVAWTNTAMAQLAGPLAPLLQRYQQGCLTLDSDASGLLWRGESSATVDPISSPVPLPSPLAAAPSPPLPPSLLLDVRGERLDLLVQDLLTRQLIREPLSERYGLSPALSERLAATPFVLRIKPLPSGPFQASLDLQLAVGKDRSAWDEWLLPLREALLAQGLTLKLPGEAKPADQTLPEEQTKPAELTKQPNPAKPGPLPPLIWQRQDGTVVGGWRWITAGDAAAANLLFFLGPLPSEVPPLMAPVPPGVALILKARPAALSSASLLPQGLPPVISQAEQLELFSATKPNADQKPGPLSSLWGSLQLAEDP